MNHNHTLKNDPRPVPSHARVSSGNDEQASLQQLPAGGWMREVSCHENWRTTTIVHRHRDQATTVSSH